MKRSTLITAMFILLAGTILNAENIIGSWEVKQTGDITYIENTADGIKAKIGSQGPWYYYEKVSKREYVDKRGNAYRIESSDHITWQSRDRSKVFDLLKVNTNRHRNDQDGYHPDSYNQKDRYRGSNDKRKSKRHYDQFEDDWYEAKDRQRNENDRYGDLHRKHRQRDHIAYYLEGKWELNRGRTKLKIRTESSRRIYVKFRDSYHGNKIFKQDRRHPNVFVDKHGHRLILDRKGRLIMDIPGYGKRVLHKKTW